MAVEIIQITTHRGLKKFVRFGNEFYKDCEHFCPQLIGEEMDVFDPKINPAHEVCEFVLFMAYRDKRAVGRIAGVINYAANEKWGVKKVRFGWSRDRCVISHVNSACSATYSVHDSHVISA